LLKLKTFGSIPEASCAECLMEAKSTYALRSADPGLSRRFTNLCFRIACINPNTIKESKREERQSMYNISTTISIWMIHSDISLIVHDNYQHKRNFNLWTLSSLTTLSLTIWVPSPTLLIGFSRGQNSFKRHNTKWHLSSTHIIPPSTQNLKDYEFMDLLSYRVLNFFIFTWDINQLVCLC